MLLKTTTSQKKWYEIAPSQTWASRMCSLPADPHLILTNPCQIDEKMVFQVFFKLFGWEIVL